MKKNKIIVIFILVICIFNLLRRVFVLEPIIKTAIRREDIKGKYIVCKSVRTTGFDWYVTEATEGLRSKAYCNIVGPIPWDYSLPYEFEISSNLFVFYVDEQREYYSEEIREEMLEYMVSGWDIIYPVHRDGYSGIEFLVKSPKYILESDLRKR
ncbi:MAG: hypothetical protein Q4A19_05285 [Johnsonella sp.]|nr:hypothetical protein [Johnsonella sp.]